jgi:hypothetical protein
MRCRHGQLVTVREENGGGAERCVWLLASLIAGAHMALVVYDITDLVITLRPHLHRTANHQLPNNETDMRVHACKHTTHRHERTCTQLLPLPATPAPASQANLARRGHCTCIRKAGSTACSVRHTTSVCHTTYNAIPNTTGNPHLAFNIQIGM